MARFVLSLVLCYFVLVFFSPLSIAITSLGEERANLSTFRTFVRFALLVVSVSSSSWCLGRAAACDCGTPWTFVLPFLQISTTLAVKSCIILVCLFMNVCKLLNKSQIMFKKKGKRKVQGVPQSQTAALPRPQEEEETDKSKQAQTEQTYEKH